MKTETQKQDAGGSLDVAAGSTPEGAPPKITYQPQHMWSDGEFDQIWSPIGEPTVSKVITRQRLDLYLSIHPGEKVRVLKITSAAEVTDADEFFQKEHGATCEKAPHDSQRAYMHDERDDSAYEVDGVQYCGRCHTFLSNAHGETRGT